MHAAAGAWPKKYHDLQARGSLVVVRWSHDRDAAAHQDRRGPGPVTKSLEMSRNVGLAGFTRLYRQGDLSGKAHGPITLCNSGPGTRPTAEDGVCSRGPSSRIQPSTAFCFHVMAQRGMRIRPPLHVEQHPPVPITHKYPEPKRYRETLSRYHLTTTLSERTWPTTTHAIGQTSASATTTKSSLQL
ncbi:hypothetical protein PSPO01_13737 [Paraphaeosphaeria sporulosa]